MQHSGGGEQTMRYLTWTQGASFCMARGCHRPKDGCTAALERLGNPSVCVSLSLHNCRFCRILNHNNTGIHWDTVKLCISRLQSHLHSPGTHTPTHTHTHTHAHTHTHTHARTHTHTLARTVTGTNSGNVFFCCISAGIFFPVSSALSKFG